MLYLAYEDAEKAVIYKPNNPDVSCGWESDRMGFPESSLMILFISRLLFVTERSTWQQDAMRWHWCSSAWLLNWIPWWKLRMNCSIWWKELLCWESDPGWVSRGGLGIWTYLDNVWLIILAVTKRIPWVGAGIGIILGVGLVLADQLIPESPSIRVRTWKQKNLGNDYYDWNL